MRCDMRPICVSHRDIMMCGEGEIMMCDPEIEMRWPGDKIKRLSRSRLITSKSGMSRSFWPDYQSSMKIVSFWWNRVKSGKTRFRERDRSLQMAQNHDSRGLSTKSNICTTFLHGAKRWSIPRFHAVVQNALKRDGLVANRENRQISLI